MGFSLSLPLSPSLSLYLLVHPWVVQQLGVHVGLCGEAVGVGAGGHVELVLEGAGFGLVEGHEDGEDGAAPLNGCHL